MDNALLYSFNPYHKGIKKAALCPLEIRKSYVGINLSAKASELIFPNKNKKKTKQNSSSQLSTGSTVQDALCEFQ